MHKGLLSRGKMHIFSPLRRCTTEQARMLFLIRTVKSIRKDVANRNAFTSRGDIGKPKFS